MSREWVEEIGAKGSPLQTSTCLLVVTYQCHRVTCFLGQRLQTLCYRCRLFPGFYCLHFPQAAPRHWQQDTDRNNAFMQCPVLTLLTENFCQRNKLIC